MLALHVDLVIQMWDVQNDGVPTPLLTSQLWCSEIVSWCAAAEEEGAGPEGALDLYVVALCCFCCAAAILFSSSQWWRAVWFKSGVSSSSFFRWQPLFFFVHGSFLHQCFLHSATLSQVFCWFTWWLYTDGVFFILFFFSKLPYVYKYLDRDSASD